MSPRHKEPMTVALYQRPNLRVTPSPAQDVWDIIIVCALGGLIVACGWLVLQ